ncbi:MAG: neutral/alkaline non-lysosomal ceramidase N-terminal domain-containing protein [Nannocystis sp.]|nr:neutral/alkaline non-lysosomal ceramidase N-terminal domain-containing protein [Nannocystis sp.]MBA3550052.1 neutral/alkaline non-lysosomal ceramidase N-terminal domain-containing protein [Nannocystis sp.]
MSRLPCLLLFTLAACSDPAPENASAGSSTSSGASSSSTGGAQTSVTPTTGSSDLTGTDSTGGAEGGQTTGSSSGATTDEPGTTTVGTTTDDSTTGGPVLEHFLLGMDVQDVSPSPEFLAKDVYMGAYGAPYMRGPAKGVHDPIFARSFAVEGNGGGLVMSIVDLPGMGNQISREVRAKVAEMTGLSPAQVLVGSTHSHSAPDFMGLWGGVPGDYRSWLVDQVAASMTAAWTTREPGTLKVSTGKAPANNRRGWGFTDDDMTILEAIDLEDQRIGAVVVFAAHPVVLGMDNTMISCDYPGYFVQSLEATLGAPVALFNGTLGDATPKVPDGDYADDFARAEAYGELLSSIAAEIVAAGVEVEPELEFSHVEWVQSVDNLLFKAASALGILMFDFEMKGLDQKVTTQSTYFRLGKLLQGVAFPGESLTRNGLAIKKAMVAPHKLILGNTGDALGYFIPGDEWQTGKNDDYEETVSMGKTAGDNARAAITPLIVAGNAAF